ncbi:MAG: glycosyltransferase family 2 protein [Nitrospinae bacterium]|nr:glycosyltransferase family 2 protein [Nitrospinota bacterium]
MEKLSVTIITKNEEENIGRSLESLKWVDEIVVVDTNSSDRTVEICRQHTDQVFNETWHGYGKQKNICAAHAKNRWILNIDADEVVTPESAEEIQKVLQEGPQHPVYHLPRKNYFGDRWVRFGGWYPDRILRLYDKEKIAFSESQVHERLTPDNNAGSLKHPLIHYSYRDYEDYIKRQDRYSTLYAQEKMAKGFRANWMHLYLRPPLTFIKNFVLKKGFMDGFLGLFLAKNSAIYTHQKYAKTRSFKNSSPLEEDHPSP